MRVTDVRVTLSNADGGVLAYCVVTLDDEIVVRDIKIIRTGARLLVVMPSRRLQDRCEGCGTKNHLRARFCNHCGARQPPGRESVDEEGRAILYADVVHPITAVAREHMVAEILRRYEEAKAQESSSC